MRIIIFQFVLQAVFSVERNARLNWKPINGVILTILGSVDYEQCFNISQDKTYMRFSTRKSVKNNLYFQNLDDP